MKCLVVVVSSMIWLASTHAFAQEDKAVTQEESDPEKTTIQLPVFTTTRVSTTVSVPDGGVFLSGVRMRTDRTRKSSRAILSSLRGQNQICSVTTEEGVTKYDVLFDNKPVKVAVQESGQIDITVVRVYTEENIEELRANHPDVMMHVHAFPKTSNAESKIRLSIEAETTLTFESEKELELENPSLYPIYQLCAGNSGSGLILTVTPRIIIQDEDEE